MYLCIYVCIYVSIIYVSMYLCTPLPNSCIPNHHALGFFNWPRPRKQSSAGGECVFRVWPDKGIIESCSFRTTKMESTAPTCANGYNGTMIHSIVRLKYQWYTGYHRIMFCLICKGNFLSTCFQDQFPGGLRSGYSHTTPPNLPSTRWTFHVDASESLVVNQISLIVCPITVLFTNFIHLRLFFSDFFWTIQQISHQSLKTSWSGSPSTFHSPAIFQVYLGTGFNASTKARISKQRLPATPSCRRLLRHSRQAHRSGFRKVRSGGRGGGLRRCGWDGDEARFFF